MKRISLIFAFVSALILSLGISAWADDGSISVASVKGIFGTNQLNTKTPNYRFVLQFNNTTGKKVDCANGWRIYSTDGAIWSNYALDTLGPMIKDLVNDPPDPDKCFARKYFDVAFGGQWTDLFDPANPATPDTVGFLGAGGSGASKQYTAGKTDTLFALMFDGPADPTTNDGKHICIDTSFWGTGGTWVWVADGGSTAFYPAFTSAFGTPTATGFCFQFFNVPNIPPSITNCPATLPDKKWCSTFTFDFNAVDTDNPPDPYTFVLVSGPGTIDPATGVWVYTPSSCADAGPKTLVVAAKDNVNGPTCTVNFNVTNAAPVMDPALCGKTFTDKINVPVNVTLSATDPDGCGTISYTTATPGASITGNVLTFQAAAEGTYAVEVAPFDGCATGQPCTINFTLLAGGKYWVEIEKTHGTIQGGFETVDVKMTKAFYDAILGGMGGFNFLIAYDNSALSLQGVLNGDSPLFTPKPNGCGWEYFTYRFGADGNCSGGCPSGLVRVVGIAESNNGPNHPGCETYGMPEGVDQNNPLLLFQLKFLVSNDRTLNCSYAPVQFFWIDCTDNSISSKLGNDLYIENDVYMYNYADGWGNAAVPDSLSVLPGYFGILKGSCPGIEGKGAPHEDIDFYNGGVDIACSDSIDARGDINMNGIGYEIADAVLFSRYFVYGDQVWTPLYRNGQIAATDVNADGLVLTVSDLVYLIRVIIGDALPYAKLSPVTASYTHFDNGNLTVDASIGAAYVVVKGDVKPTLLADGMSMMYAFDGSNTRILVSPNLETMAVGFTGDFLNVNGEIVSVEMATAEGAPVVGKLVPANFGLSQNYPNPFNPTTKIGFALPKTSAYSLTIYNVTGQKVAEFTGTHEAGNVEIEWNASGNASGIYFYKLNAGNYSETKKMVLLK